MARFCNYRYILAKELRFSAIWLLIITLQDKMCDTYAFYTVQSYTVVTLVDIALSLGRPSSGWDRVASGISEKRAGVAR